MSMRRFWTLITLACLAFWGTLIGGGIAIARADTLVLNPDGTPSVYQAVADHAMIPTPDITVVVHQNGCMDVSSERSCTYEGGDIYLSPGYRPGEFLHELGHQVWYRVPKFQRDWPRRDRANSPHEKFGEAWRTCAEWGAFDYPPMPAQVEGFGYGYWPYHETATCKRFVRIMRKAGISSPTPIHLRLAQEG